MTIQKTAAQHLNELEELIAYNVKQAQTKPDAVLENDEPDMLMGAADAESNMTVKKQEVDPTNPNIQYDPTVSEEYKQASFLAKNILNDIKKQGKEENVKEDDVENKEKEKKAAMNLYKMGADVAVAALKDLTITKEANGIRKLGYNIGLTALEKLGADIAALRPQLETLVIQKILTEAEKEAIEQAVGNASNVDEEFINNTAKDNEELKKTLESIYLGKNVPNESKEPQTLDTSTEKVAWLKNWGY